MLYYGGNSDCGDWEEEEEHIFIEREGWREGWWGDTGALWSYESTIWICVSLTSHPRHIFADFNLIWLLFKWNSSRQGTSVG